MTTRIQDNMFKAIFIIVLFIVLICKSVAADAQIYGKDEKSYKGFVASFATRSAIVSSDARNLSRKTDDAAFAHTKTTRQMQVIVGISFHAAPVNADIFRGK